MTHWPTPFAKLAHLITLLRLNLPALSGGSYTKMVSSRYANSKEPVDMEVMLLLHELEISVDGIFWEVVNQSPAVGEDFTGFSEQPKRLLFQLGWLNRNANLITKFPEHQQFDIHTRVADLVSDCEQKLGLSWRDEIGAPEAIKVALNRTPRYDEKATAKNPELVLVDAISAGPELNIQPSTIRKWASRGQVKRHGIDDRGRSLYSLHELAAKAQKVGNYDGK